MFEALILVQHRRHLVFADGKHQLFHFQAAMMINGVKISSLTILTINRAVEVVGLTLADAGVNKRGVVGWINRKVKPDDTIASVGGMVNINLLTSLVIGSAIKNIALASTNSFIDDGFIRNRPVVQMQVHRLVAAILGLKMVFIHARFAHRFTIEIISVILADGLIDVFSFIGMHHNRDANILCAISIIKMASIGRAAQWRSGHRVLRSRVVERIGWRPSVSVTTHTSHSHSV